MFRTLTCSECVDASIEWRLWGHGFIIIKELLKPNLKIRQSKIAIALKENPNPETRTNPNPDCNPDLHFRVQAGL